MVEDLPDRRGAHAVEEPEHAVPRELVGRVVEQAEERALEAEAAAQEARRRKREEDRLAAIEAEFQAAEAENRSEPDGAGDASAASTNGAESADVEPSGEAAGQSAEEGEAAS